MEEDKQKTRTSIESCKGDTSKIMRDIYEAHAGATSNTRRMQSAVAWPGNSPSPLGGPCGKLQAIGLDVATDEDTTSWLVWEMSGPIPRVTARSSRIARTSLKETKR